MRNAINAKAEAGAGAGGRGKRAMHWQRERCAMSAPGKTARKSVCLGLRVPATGNGLRATGYGLRATVAYKVQII